MVSNSHFRWIGMSGKTYAQRPRRRSSGRRPPSRPGRRDERMRSGSVAGGELARQVRPALPVGEMLAGQGAAPGRRQTGPVQDSCL